MDHWCLVLARTGPETDAHVLERTGLRRKPPRQSPPGSILSFRSLALPFEGSGQDDEVLTLLLPRATLPQLDGNLGSALNPDIPPAMQGLLAGYLTSLARTLPQLTHEQANALAEPTAALIAACVAPTLQRIEAAAVPLSSTLIERAIQVVRQNMASPDFGPDHLCRLLAMSRSKLYRHFEKFGGVASFIQRVRLREAFARLEDQGAIRSIHRIAEDVGFSDHSTFSRAFRREYGFSPSEARESALAEPAWSQNRPSSRETHRKPPPGKLPVYAGGPLVQDTTLALSRTSNSNSETIQRYSSATAADPGELDFDQ